MASKIKAPSGITFKGVFKFPKLKDPDFGNDEFPKPDGEFSVKLIGKLDDPDVQAFIAKWQPMHDDAVARAQEEFKKLKVDVRKKLKEVTVNPLYTELYDEETEEPTGEVEIKFSMKYSGEFKKGPKAGQKWYRRPDIFDARGNKMKPTPDIWGGTVGRVAFEVGLNKEMMPGYFIPGTGAAGLSLRLKAARVIELVSAGERDASAYGFDKEEEGYVHDPSSFASDNQDDAGGDDTGGSEPGSDNPDF